MAHAVNSTPDLPMVQQQLADRPELLAKLSG
jgi:hypothetical protein